MKKEAIFFKRQSVILKTNSFDHEGDGPVCAHFKTHFVDSVIFAAAGFFSSSVFCISFPCFPGFLHCARAASVGLGEAITTEGYTCKTLLAFLSFLWKEFDPMAGEQKRMHYIIFNQSQCKDLNCHVLPPTFYQIW